ncbi:phosphatase PAP2 family protein [soil metagenome]
MLPMQTRPSEVFRAISRQSRQHPRLRRGLTEAALLVVLYVGYSASRLLADNDFGSARDHALELVRFEQVVGLNIEPLINGWFTDIDWLGIAGSFWYASAHYIVTVGILIWLFVSRQSEYLLARRALVLATVIGLGFYLLLPMAPPRFIDGYVDVLSQYSSVGWWGADASAPRGLGQITNELAAMPSLHAGYALWVAIVVWRTSSSLRARRIAIAYAAITAFVIVGTGNHWVLDAVVGWMVVGFSYAIVLSASTCKSYAAHRSPLAERARHD